MIAKELKRSILLAAISGKLTVQEQYESAHKLFDIKDIITEYISFDLPDNWVWTKLGVIGSWKAGATPLRSKSEYYKNGTIPWLKTGDLNNSYINSVTEFITLKAIEETSITIQPIGAILIAMYGATIGKLGILNIEATTNQACCACTVNEKINNKYLFYYLMAIKDEFVGKGVGGAQPNISKEKIVKTLISVPPIEEQKRIVEKLDELLPLIDSLEKGELKLNELMQKFPESMKASILQAAIQGRLTNQLLEDGNASIEFEKHIQVHPMKYPDTPFEIPYNWIFEKLGNFVSVVTGTSYNSSDLDFDGIRILRGGNLIDKTHSVQFQSDDIFISKDMFDITKQPKEKDIVIVASTGSKTVIGKPAFVDQNLDNVQIGAFLRIIRPKYSKYAEYLRLIFMSKYYRNHITNTTQGTNINNISKKHIEDLLIPIPPLSEQKRIIEKVKQILPIVETISTKTN